MTTSGPRREVGRIAKAHGVRGEVVVELLTERLERVQPGARLVAGDRELVVAASRPRGTPAGGRGLAGVFLVRFEGVDDRNAAEALRGRRLEAEAVPEDADDDATWVHELIGARVVEVDGTERGVVTAVEANPAADLLVLDSGALVPMTFVEAVEPGRVTVDVPAGLFD